MYPLNCWKFGSHVSIVVKEIADNASYFIVTSV
jgi:hypothetical protein